MRKIIIGTVMTTILAACSGPVPMAKRGPNNYIVKGVEAGDMLKLRSGPGTTFDIYAGLPNGTIVQVQSCSAVEGTNWCKISLDRAPDLEGYVSQTYLQKL